MRFMKMLRQSHRFKNVMGLKMGPVATEQHKIVKDYLSVTMPCKELPKRKAPKKDEIPSPVIMTLFADCTIDLNERARALLEFNPKLYALGIVSAPSYTHAEEGPTCPTCSILTAEPEAVERLMKNDYLVRISLIDLSSAPRAL